MYYLDTNYIVQELCYTDGKGWYSGAIGNMKAKATPGSGLAAIVFGKAELGGGEDGEHIRVYYQGEHLRCLSRCLFIETPDRIRDRYRQGIGE